jgi:hypothetical protein
MTAHADASPSSSSIWINCPASVTKARGKKRLPTVYTTEGSAAHEVADMLIHGLPAPDSVALDGTTVEVDDDMVEAVERYVVFIETLKAKADVFDTEVSVRLRAFGGEDIFGTADVISYREKTKTLDVVDLKYGKGVAVSAKGNSQLRIYALGAIRLLSDAGWDEIDKIRLTIIQPRTETDPGLNCEEITVDELVAWRDTVLNIATEKLSRNDPTENPGAHCRWCVRAGECASLAKLAQSEARVVFDKKGALHPEVLTDKELAGILDSAEMITAWMEKVRQEASQRLDHGGAIPGWKLVAKRAMEKWIDPDDALADLNNMFPHVDGLLKLRTPAQVKKTLKAAKENPDIVAAYTCKDSSGNTLARDDDTRPRVETSPKTVFDMLKTSLELPD